MTPILLPKADETNMHLLFFSPARFLTMRRKREGIEELISFEPF
jgi:hypothetical protein